MLKNKTNFASKDDKFAIALANKCAFVSFIGIGAQMSIRDLTDFCPRESNVWIRTVPNPK